MFRTLLAAAALLALPAPVLAMGGTIPSDAAAAAANREAKAEAAVPQAELDVLANLNGTVVTIRNDPATPAAERTASDPAAKALTKAYQAAIAARSNANRAAFNTQASVVRTQYNAACSVLTAC